MPFFGCAYAMQTGLAVCPSCCHLCSPFMSSVIWLEAISLVQLPGIDVTTHMSRLCDRTPYIFHRLFTTTPICCICPVPQGVHSLCRAYLCKAVRQDYKMSPTCLEYTSFRIVFRKCRAYTCEAARQDCSQYTSTFSGKAVPMRNSHMQGSQTGLAIL